MIPLPMAPRAMPCTDPLKPGCARKLPTFEFQASLGIPQRAEHSAPLPGLTRDSASYDFTADQSLQVLSSFESWKFQQPCMLLGVLQTA